MTKKDYIIIARSLRAVYQQANTRILFAVIDDIINRLVVEFQSDNPRFNEDKFRDAIYK